MKIPQIDDFIAGDQQDIAFADLMAQLIEHPGWKELEKRTQRQSLGHQVVLRHKDVPDSERTYLAGFVSGLEWMASYARTAIQHRTHFVKELEKHRARKVETETPSPGA